MPSYLGIGGHSQWVPARTPTVHWGPNNGEAVDGPTLTPQMAKSTCNDISSKRIASEVVFQPLLARVARDYTREEASLHPEFNQRDVTGGTLSPWKFLIDVVSRSLQEMVKVAVKPAGTLSSFFFGCRVSTHLRGGRRPRCVVAVFVERGPAARSTRAELVGERVRWVLLDETFVIPCYMARLLQG